MDVASLLLASLARYATERCGAARVEVVRTGAEALVASGEGWAVWEGDPCRSHPTLHVTWTSRGDVDEWTVHPELRVWVQGKVAAADAPIGGDVEAVDGEVLLGAVAGAPWSGDRPRARRAVRAGEPLTVLNVEERPAVPGGSWVTARVTRGGLEIRSDARVLADASIGEAVRVWVQATDKVVTGRLVDEHTVELGGLR